MNDRILVVEDEQDLRDLITHHLRGAGYTAVGVPSGEAGLAAVKAAIPALVLLDIMLPGMSGIEVLRTLRKDVATATLPVLLLTAQGSEVDRVVGFELGADDYVVKPFSPRELVLRVQALLRRTAPAQDGESGKAPLTAHGLQLDPDRHEVTVDGELLSLTVTEFKLLHYLMQRPGRVLSRDVLLEQVWGPDVFLTDRTVDTHVKRLRAKLGSAADALETVRGVGYRFVKP